ncbi:hypothetical protein Thimo_0568 [Thioflavicoccus mobilis 8321]|uniref:Uncharacterized protein n=1 Tax=Thioflavicoccus mobilis 8321 TaxID=765912 RepID=L0GTU7_9GAMM|nr:hypothetical protein [Thioflavicoccus mobilis]AGA89416.1 hypothetical protein Thimo_0568 [Thioflavicoccus mobilis 8321]
MTAKKRAPYDKAHYAPMPTGLTKYMRTSLIWQFYRFIVINLKYLRLMRSSE